MNQIIKYNLIEPKIIIINNIITMKAVGIVVLK
jgi:hypothetical protein